MNLPHSKGPNRLWAARLMNNQSQNLREVVGGKEFGEKIGLAIPYRNAVENIMCVILVPLRH